jgi:hypothetical protein
MCGAYVWCVCVVRMCGAYVWCVCVVGGLALRRVRKSGSPGVRESGSPVGGRALRREAPVDRVRLVLDGRELGRGSGIIIIIII